ncbi:DNA polymerase III subunit delta' [Thermosulfuriphilus sp.]
MGPFSKIIGHQRPLAHLQRALKQGQIAQAYLFYGPAGVGKATCAQALAQILLCKEGSGCGQCPSCLKMIHQTHPDFILIRPQGVQIRIADIRNLQEQLSFAPLEGQRRLVLIDEAQRLGREAANALLKILEEPPQGTHFVMVAPKIEDLLPTIVSRCQRLYFGPLCLQEAEEVLINQGLPPEDAHLGAKVSLGSPGAAMSLGPEGLKKVRETFSQIKALWGASPVEAFRLASRIDGSREEMISILKSWALLLREELLEAEDKRLPEMITLIEEAIWGLEHQGNPRLVAEALALRLSRL